MKKKNKLKYLSRSVLLEEENLPKSNRIIILVVFMVVAAFITWSFFMEIDERIEVEGAIAADPADSSTIEVILKIPPRDIENIAEGHSVTIEMMAEGEENRFRGVISRINTRLLRDETGLSYYEAIVELAMDPSAVEYYENKEDDLHVSASLITGQRTLFHYILRPFYSALDNSLQEP